MWFSIKLYSNKYPLGYEQLSQVTHNDKYRLKDNSITFNNITGLGTVDFKDLSYNIIKVEMDGKKYSKFKSNVLATKSGSHEYKIILNKWLNFCTKSLI